MNKLKGYSIWLMPAGKAYDKLSSVILELAQQYNTPVFEPHVTLIGEIEGEREIIISKTEKLLKKTSAMKIELIDINYTEDYFRALFFKVRKTSNLLLLHKKVSKLFIIRKIKKFNPHLSLMYGYIQKKDKIKIANVLAKFLPMEFDVKRIKLYSIEGNVKDWYTVKSFKLH